MSTKEYDITWHNYDPDDASTYPPHRARCLTQGSSGGLSVRTFFEPRNDLEKFEDDAFIGPGFGTEWGQDVRQPVRYAVIRESLVIKGIHYD